MASPEFGSPSHAHILALYVDMDRMLKAAKATTIVETAAAITAVALAMVPGVEQASITERRAVGVQTIGFRTIGATGDVATRGDDIQYELNSGPCVDAILNATVLRTGDVANDARWPEFGPRVQAETGTTSMLSFRLFYETDSDRERLTGLNLYSTRANAFDDSAQAIATVLATHGAQTLAAATAREKASELERALITGREVGVAIGVVMATYKITQEDAFALLRMVSQNTNRKVVELAQEVVKTGTLVLPPARRGAGSSRPSTPPPRSTT